MGDDANYKPIKRIKQACRNCRRKKARCSGERPICAFCSRLSQTCYYSDDGDSDQRPWEDSSKRKRNGYSEDSHEKDDMNHRLSAIESRLADMADTMDNIQSALQNNLPAARSPFIRDDSGFGNWRPSSAIPDAQQPSPFSRAPPMETIIGAADIYFRYCHNQPYSLFHEESFRNRLVSNEVPQHLLFAFLASSVRYSTDPYYEDKVSAISTYAVKAWKAMVLPWDGIGTDVGISIVQTILLLAIIDYTDGKTQGAWIKVGLAIRIAQDFRLMLETDPDLPPIQQEERRRVFWSFYIADKLISCGRERPPAILDANCKVQLPCDELAFRAGQYYQTPTLSEVTSESPSAALNSLSPFALTTVMASILGRCAQYTLGEPENHGPACRYPPWSPKSKFSTIHSTLLQLESDFGLGESLTAKIQREYTGVDGTIDQHRGAPLVFSHALFHLCQCLLYHPFLLRQRLMDVKAKAPLSFITQAFDGCKAAAMALSKLMDEVKLLGCKSLSTFYDPFYGYCTMVAGTVHALFSHSGDVHVVEMSQTAFEISMRNLEELSLYWKSASYMMTRLAAFRQNSSRYTVLIHPSIQITHLSQADITDLIECLDYSRLSTAPRRPSQGGNGEPRPLVSNLPSPFFDDFLNLLPLEQSFKLGDVRFSSVFEGSDDFTAIPDGPDTAAGNLPTPATTAATTMTANKNEMSGSMHPGNDPHRPMSRDEPAAGVNHHRLSSSTSHRAGFPQTTGDPSSAIANHDKQRSFSQYSHQHEDQPPIHLTRSSPISFDPLRTPGSHTTSFLPQMSSLTPLLTPAISTAPNTNKSIPAVARETQPPTSGYFANVLDQQQQQHPEARHTHLHHHHHRPSSSSTAGPPRPSLSLAARRPWYEQPQHPETSDAPPDCFLPGNLGAVDGQRGIAMTSGGEARMIRMR